MAAAAGGRATISVKFGVKCIFPCFLYAFWTILNSFIIIHDYCNVNLFFSVINAFMELEINAFKHGP